MKFVSLLEMNQQTHITLFNLFLFKKILKDTGLELRSKFYDFFDILNEFLKIDEDQIEEIIEELLPIIFDLRIEILNFLLNTKSEIEINNNQLILDQFSSYKKTNYQILIENCLFAIRTNNRITKKLFPEGKIETGTINSFNYTINYNQMIEVIGLLPNTNDKNTLINWINNSLRIEIVLLISSLIFESQEEINKKLTLKLAEIVKDNAQEFYSNSIELKLFNQNGYNLESVNFPTEYIEEQQKLADLSLAEIKNELKNW